MDRKDFLNRMGMSVVAFSVINCIVCKKIDLSPSAETTGPSGVDFTLNLSLGANAALLNNGGSLVSNGVIVAKNNAGNYIAVEQSCTHESYPITYQASNSRFYCPNHGATFSESGSVTNGPASRALTTYHTMQTGSSLRVYS